jgi:hypothetical protein
VPAFQAARHLVTNAEFLASSRPAATPTTASGTRKAWAGAITPSAEHPTFWVPDAAGWKLRLMLKKCPCPGTGRWRSTAWRRAPSAAGKRARPASRCACPPRTSGTASTTTRASAMCRTTPGRQRQPASRPLAPRACPVTRFAHGPLFDVVGNVWQWTETPIYPFDGFRRAPALRRLHHAHLRRPPQPDQGRQLDFRRQRVAPRLALRLPPPFLPARRLPLRGRRAAGYQPGLELRDRQAAVAVRRVPLRRRGLRRAQLPEGPGRLAIRPMRRFGKGRFGARARPRLRHRSGQLRAGARFERVVGIDFSARFIGLASSSPSTGVLRYTLPDEGELVTYRERRLDDLGWMGPPAASSSSRATPAT